MSKTDERPLLELIREVIFTTSKMAHSIRLVDRNLFPCIKKILPPQSQTVQLKTQGMLDDKAVKIFENSYSVYSSKRETQRDLFLSQAKYLPFYPHVFQVLQNLVKGHAHWCNCLIHVNSLDYGDLIHVSPTCTQA